MSETSVNDGGNTNEAGATQTAEGGAPANPQTATAQPAATQQPQSAAAPQSEAAPATEPAKAPSVPEKYEFKVPEGQAYNEHSVATFSEAAKEAGMTQEAAQAMLDKMAPAFAKSQQDALAKAQEKWAADFRSDPEIGGDKLDATLASAKKVLDKFAPEGFVTLLNETGLGNHVEVARFLHAVSKAISEDSVVSGGKGASSPTIAQRMYPDMNP